MVFINGVIAIILAIVVGYFISVAIGIINEREQTQETTGSVYHVREPRA